MAAYNSYVIWLIMAAVVGVMLAIATFIAKKKEKTKPSKPRGTAPIQDDAAPVRRRNRNARNRMQAGQRLQANDDDSDNDFHDDDEPFSLGLEDQMPGAKIGAKKMKRMEMKAEKRAMREQMEAERQDRKEREAMREEQRKREDERRKREEERLEAEEKARKEEEERKAYEEYLAMRNAFSVEEEGVGETEEENQALLQDFIDYIKNNKVVMLEDLACHFGLRTQDAIERLNSLQELERITGVIDDRGKFIYISPDELEAVAKFIKQRGRVTITDLAESSNKLINLKTSSTEVQASA
ncbi:DDRGK domain-containing protein 1 [Nematostella vectensis]|uniref:DDRGK domain-containing protein 1 n=1 Tax=Nematostella vectensis TaxID=45351 RepID=UPI00207793CD|nr:DDRGK domain-containing protein 1 [Nematostella vectensis]